MLGNMFSKAEEEGIMDLFTPGGRHQGCTTLNMSLTTLEQKVSNVAAFMDICGLCVGVSEMLKEIREQLERAADPLYRSHINAMAAHAAKVRMLSEDGREDY
jgi:hypothetical protein